MKILRLLPLVALFLSGAAGLIYEVVWSRAAAALFGSVLTATGSLLALFMAGLGLGASVGARWAERSRRPLLAFGVVEVVVGCLAATTPRLLVAAAPLVERLDSGLPERLAPLVPAAVLLVILGPIVLLLGATFPLFLAHFESGPTTVARASGRVYGVNTLGAVLGTVVGGTMLIPLVGIARSLELAAATDLVVGLVCIALGWKEVRAVAPASSPAASAPPGRPRQQPGDRSGLGPEGRLAVAVAFLGGAAALILEIAWFRALMLIFGSSVHALTMMLAAFLLGIAGGAMVVAGRADRTGDPAGWLGTTHLLIAFSATMVTILLQVLPALFIPVLKLSGGSFAVLAWGTLAIQLLALLAPTTLMGVAVPLAIRLAATGREGSAALPAGRVYGASSFGSCLGALAASFVLVPGLGLRGAVASAVLLSLAAAALSLSRALGPDRRRQGIQVAALTAAIWGGWAAGLVPWEWRVLTGGYYAYAHLYAGVPQPPAGARQRTVELADPHPFTAGVDGRADDPGATVSAEPRLVSWEEGAFAQVAVVDDGGVRSLLVNGKADASSGPEDMRTQLLLGHLAVLLAPDEVAGPAMVIGLGSGVTAGAVATWPFPRVVVAEIEPAVVRASRWFEPWNGRVLADPRLDLRLDDGRRVLARHRGELSLITSEPSNLWMAGVSLLFTREFFELAADRLGPRGVMCQWLHLYQVGPDDVRSLVRTLGSAFPHMVAFVDGGDLLLVASGSPLELDPRVWQRRLVANPRAAGELARAGLGSGLDLARGLVADEQALAAWSQGAPLHTDDRPLLEFSAARHLARDHSASIVADLVRFAEAAGPLDLGGVGMIGGRQAAAADSPAARNRP